MSERRLCRDCGTEFFVDDGQIAWFVQQGLAIPKRCPECRRAKRLAKQQAQRDEIEREPSVRTSRWSPKF